MATSSLDGTVRIWDFDDLTMPPIILEDNDGKVLAISFSPDGKVLISASESDLALSNLIVRPTHIDYMVGDICNILSRNFTESEWRINVGADIDYEETCESKDLSIKVQEKKGK